MNIYVGNLSSDVTEQDLREAFEPFGAPSSVAIIKDKFTGEPRGFGFVELPSEEASKLAISQLNGKDLKGKTLTVNEARSKKDGPRGGGGGRDFRGGNNRRPGGGGSSGGGYRSQRSY
jgi:RNA recognition motif-containing protein